MGIQPILVCPIGYKYNTYYFQNQSAILNPSRSLLGSTNGTRLSCKPTMTSSTGVKRLEFEFELREQFYRVRLSPVYRRRKHNDKTGGLGRKFAHSIKIIAAASRINSFYKSARRTFEWKQRKKNTTILSPLTIEATFRLPIIKAEIFPIPTPATWHTDDLQCLAQKLRPNSTWRIEA